MPDFLDITSREMVERILPLCHGPFVKIRIKSEDVEYTVSKPLLCKESSYFSTILDGKSTTVEDKPLNGKGRPTKEEEKPTTGEEQVVTLENIEGIVSRRSIECLLQWLYSRKIGFNPGNPEEKVSTAIKVARLAEMCSIVGLDTLVVQYIKSTLAASVGGQPRANATDRVLKTHVLTREHIFAAGYLRRGHPVRRVVAAASVEGFFLDANYKFVKEDREHPTFAADLLAEVRWALQSLSCKGGCATVTDPLDGEIIKIGYVEQPPGAAKKSL
ncbi:uncharacterized protein N7496_003307 [Penicillium cataractarum]|uniref:BTB domain-containing protein n=1 Tax=Penicillium cataractarum TaxID=2100454 RepID=A0A9W9SNC5_9EURO|nr:uncharacterized protein N7496_003307 [Penicillium cataractarum]KAJ5380879.1 hypothetical protein N7496_003307 [Penicillium cataractarum]